MFERTLARVALRVVAVLPGALAGCASGPDFVHPEAPSVSAGHPYTAAPLPLQTASAAGTSGAAQRFVPATAVPEQWWSLFHSPSLDELVKRALTASPTVAAAQAALRQSREAVEAQVGASDYPGVGLQAGAGRQRALIPGAPSPAAFNLYNASVSVSYVADTFGGARRQIESLEAAVDYQAFEAEATYLSLTANVVTAAIQEASLRAQLQATRDVLGAEEHSLAVIEKQASLGAIAQAPVLTQKTEIAQTRAGLPPLEKALAHTRNQLATYAGMTPSQAILPEFNLSSLQLPSELPLTLPSALARQRPDIRASEAMLHEASAQIGVATANLYPRITLSASLGGQGSTLTNLLSGSTTLWSLAAGIAQPLFDGGTLKAKQRGAVAAYDGALAQYRQVVLIAFQNVADALNALDIDAKALKAQAEAEALSRESVELATRQYRLGGASYLGLLDAQRTWHQSQIGLVQARAARFADTVALFQALGGGWWNREARIADR